VVLTRPEAARLARIQVAAEQLILVDDDDNQIGVASREENEFCALFSGRYDGSLRANDAEISGLRWVRLDDLITEIRADPVSHTSWLIGAATRFASLRDDGAQVRK
jgi:isopentenyldiphosphate isomerase